MHLLALLPQAVMIAQSVPAESFEWGPALRQSFFFLSVQHTSRLAQKKMRREFGGPFFRDWGDSIKGIQGWCDGDAWLTNYLGHPWLGGITGYIQIQNDPRGRRLQFENSPRYWTSRMKAMAWSAAYSTQFEIGPISEAAIGNVGKNPGTAGWVDLVVTPTLGTAALIGEDALDRYYIQRWETRNAHVLRITRTFLNPSRSIANLLRFKRPWHRDNR